MKQPTITSIGLGTALCGLAVGTAWALSLASSVEVPGHHPQTRAGSALAIGNIIKDDTNPALIVGAPAFEGGDLAGGNTDGPAPSGWPGAVLIYRGTSSGPEHDPAIVVHGVAPNDRFGTAVKVANVVGSPDPDLIVSAIFASGHDAYHSGCVYIFEGPIAATATPPAPTVLEAHNATAEVCGTQYRQQFGRSLATGDYDGDGATDIVAGSPWYSEAHSHESVGHPSDGYLTGATYLITSAAIAAHVTDPTMEVDAPFSHGAGWTAAYGETLLAMPNLTPAPTDGRERLLIFAPGAENHGHSGNGRAYLASWNPDPVDPNVPLAQQEPIGFEDPLVVVQGMGGLGAGKPDFIGDIDGDGKPEIGMASSTAKTPSGEVVDTNSAGGLYVVNGDLLGSAYQPYSKTVDPLTNMVTAETVNKLGDVSLAAITGELAQDKFGTSMVGLGDLNGDLVEDFAVGAPWADGLTITHTGPLRSIISGTVYLIDGSGIKNADPSDRFKFKIRGTAAAPLLTGVPEIPGASNDRLGEALAAGDVIPTAGTAKDLMIGAPDHDLTFTSTQDDIPGTNSNDNRGSVFIESFGP